VSTQSVNTNNVDTLTWAVLTEVMSSVSTIFESLGGPTKVARILGVGFTTASEMKRRGSIPVKYWPKLVEACETEGINDVNYERLVAMHSEAAQ
jgi:hypothetical protein